MPTTCVVKGCKKSTNKWTTDIVTSIVLEKWIFKQIMADSWWKAGKRNRRGLHGSFQTSKNVFHTFWRSSVSHILVIACAFALRECISLISQPFTAQLYLSPYPAMWFPEYVWGSACETHSTLSLGVRALSKTQFHKAKCWLHRLYIYRLWYDLKACCWTILVLWAWRVSWQPFLSSLSMVRLFVMVDPRYTNSWTTSSL